MPIDAAAPPTLLRPDELRPAVELARRLVEQLDRMLLGRPELHQLVLAAILSRGHLLLEGVPGVGKTALVKALGQLLQPRLQASPVHPGPDARRHPGHAHPAGGPAEIRRSASGRWSSGPAPSSPTSCWPTRSTEPRPRRSPPCSKRCRSTVSPCWARPDTLPEPFFVLASQNPIEMEGTYPLPEAQLDRFLFKLVVNTVDADVLDRIISTRRRGDLPAPEWKMQERRAATRCSTPWNASSCPGRCRATSPGWWPPRIAAGNEAVASVQSYVTSWGVAPGGHRPGRGGSGLRPAGGPAHGRLRGRPGGGRPCAEPSADPELQGPSRPGQYLRRGRRSAQESGRNRPERARMTLSSVISHTA